jgi:hypothetical protein
MLVVAIRSYTSHDDLSKLTQKPFMPRKFLHLGFLETPKAVFFLQVSECVDGV